MSSLSVPDIPEDLEEVSTEVQVQVQVQEQVQEQEVVQVQVQVVHDACTTWSRCTLQGSRKHSCASCSSPSLGSRILVRPIPA